MLAFHVQSRRQTFAQDADRCRSAEAADLGAASPCITELHQLHCPTWP
jgi:hypothetical protein